MLQKLLNFLEIAEKLGNVVDLCFLFNIAKSGPEVIKKILMFNSAEYEILTAH